MIAIFARLFALLLAVTAVALVVVALSPRAQAEDAAGPAHCRSPSAIAGDCRPVERTDPTSGEGGDARRS